MARLISASLPAGSTVLVSPMFTLGQQAQALWFAGAITPKKDLAGALVRTWVRTASTRCMGGGATQVAVISMYGIVAAETMRAGGLQMDEAIVAYVRKKYGVIIGPSTAEQLKIRIDAATPQDKEEGLEVQGQDQVSGLPRPVTLATGEIVEALLGPLKQVVETCRRVLEKTPPELVSDIIDRGVALCGGGAMLRGADKLLTKTLGIPAYLVDNPCTCTVEGAVKALGMYSTIKRNLPPV